jgi:hypothetical protein
MDFKKRVIVRIGFNWLRLHYSEHGEEFSCSAELRSYLDHLRNLNLFKSISRHGVVCIAVTVGIGE